MQAASQYLSSYFSNIDPRNPGTGCTLDGQKMPIQQCFNALRNGSLGSVVFSTTGGMGGGSGEVAPLAGAFAFANGRQQGGQRRPGSRTGLTISGEEGSILTAIPASVDDLPSSYDAFGMFWGVGAYGNLSIHSQSRVARPQTPKLLLVSDDAGRYCIPSDVSTIYLKNRSASLFEPVPHTWLQVPSGSWGFGPNGWYREGPGKVHNNSNPIKYHSDVTIPYSACPESISIIEKAIKDNNDGWYVYSNRPFKTNVLELFWFKENGDLFDLRLKVLPAGYNCTGWACRMLEIAGFSPPVASSKARIGPGYRKR